MIDNSINSCICDGVVMDPADCRAEPGMLEELERQLQVDAEPLQSERLGNSYIALAHAAVKRVVDDACSRANMLRFSIGRRTLTLEERRASILKRIDENKSFGRMLMRLVSEKCDGKASICYKGAGVSRQIYSRIISDPTSRVSRRTAFQLCIGLRLTCEEADRKSVV